MEKKPRLIGIDLLRGIAIYAVTIFHSDEGILVKLPSWTEIAQVSGFVVPFFLATSFYLTTERLYASDRPYNLKSRLTRLLVPYGIWSILYLLHKTFKYALKHDFDKLLDIFQDPVAIIFLGGAAFHLYFLPLLVSGTVLLKLTELLIKYKTQIKYLILFFILSLIAYQWLLVTANSFRLELNIAFQSLVTQNYLANNPAVRLFLVWLSWVIRCTPYIFWATILYQQNITKKSLKFADSNLIVCCIGFVIFNIYDRLSFPKFIYELFRGYAALHVAIS